MTQPWTLCADLSANAKWAFTTRRVARSDAATILDDLDAVRAGDLVLGRVERVGSHRRIQLADGRGSELYAGDLVVLVCGDRYAPDQFEGAAELDPAGADMLAAGGVIGRMRHAHSRMGTPTCVVPLGLVADAARRVLNVEDYGLAPLPRPASLPVIGIVGASMNAGKTTAVAALAHGLGRAGYRVAAIKATGTGAFNDFHAYADAGAHVVSDFTDAGMASTYRQPLTRILAGIDTLLGDAAQRGAEIAVVELADGLLQAETAALLREPRMRGAFAGLVLAVPDAMGAVGGCVLLNDIGLAPDVLTGMVSCSPLATAEAEAATGVSVIAREALRDPAQARALAAPMLARAAGRTAADAAAGVDVAA